jgi:uncharacterized protein (TIGR02147 family)
VESLDVFSYLDYRDFCRDFYQTHKIKNSKFSYRYFAKRAQVAPAYLKHIIDGKRNLSPEMSHRFAAGMGLDHKQQEYFELLVRFNQAHSLDEKSLYFEGLRKRRSQSLKSLGLAEAASLLSHWYVVVIKELMVVLNTDAATPIQEVLRKKLPLPLIEKVIGDLKGLGWVSQEEGRWRSSAHHIRFPDEIKSYVIRSFHHQMLTIAQEALSDEIDEREFGAAVFTFPKERWPELKLKIKEMQSDLVNYVQDMMPADKNSEQDLLNVYFVGIQCFSMQKEGERSEKNPSSS